MRNNENNEKKHIPHEHSAHLQPFEVDDDDFELEGDRGDSPFKVHLLAGSVAGLMEHVLIFPVDTIKVDIY